MPLNRTDIALPYSVCLRPPQTTDGPIPTSGGSLYDIEEQDPADIAHSFNPDSHDNASNAAIAAVPITADAVHAVDAAPALPADHPAGSQHAEVSTAPETDAAAPRGADTPLDPAVAATAAATADSNTSDQVGVLDGDTVKVVEEEVVSVGKKSSVCHLTPSWIGLSSVWVPLPFVLISHRQILAPAR